MIGSVRCFGENTVTAEVEFVAISTTGKTYRMFDVKEVHMLKDIAFFLLLLFLQYGVILSIVLVQLYKIQLVHIILSFKDPNHF